MELTEQVEKVTPTPDDVERAWREGYLAAREDALRHGWTRADDDESWRP